MIFGCLGTSIKHIDRSDINTAFVSRMKGDIPLYGNELIYANTAFAIANFIGLWRCNLLLKRSNPMRFISLLAIGWTICTFGQAAMKAPAHMYALKTMLGLFETGHQSTILHLCSRWYQNSELNRRLAIINAAMATGPVSSSYLQAAIYKGNIGVSGSFSWMTLSRLSLSFRRFLNSRCPCAPKV